MPRRKKKPKWGRIGPPGSAKRKAWMRKIRQKGKKKPKSKGKLRVGASTTRGLYAEYEKDL